MVTTHILLLLLALCFCLPETSQSSSGRKQETEIERLRGRCIVIINQGGNCFVIISRLTGKPEMVTNDRICLLRSGDEYCFNKETYTPITNEELRWIKSNGRRLLRSRRN